MVLGWYRNRVAYRYSRMGIKLVTQTNINQLFYGEYRLFAYIIKNMMWMWLNMGYTWQFQMKKAIFNTKMCQAVPWFSFHSGPKPCGTALSDVEHDLLSGFIDAHGLKQTEIDSRVWRITYKQVENSSDYPGWQSYFPCIEFVWLVRSCQ